MKSREVEPVGYTDFTYGEIFMRLLHGIGVALRDRDRGLFTNGEGFASWYI